MTMESYDKLIEILEASVKKNGSIPLTTQHLLNLLKMAERDLEREERDDFRDDTDIY